MQDNPSVCIVGIVVVWGLYEGPTIWAYFFSGGVVGWWLKEAIRFDTSKSRVENP